MGQKLSDRNLQRQHRPIQTTTTRCDRDGRNKGKIIEEDVSVKSLWMSNGSDSRRKRPTSNHRNRLSLESLLGLRSESVGSDLVLDQTSRHSSSTSRSSTRSPLRDDKDLDIPSIVVFEQHRQMPIHEKKDDTKFDNNEKHSSWKSFSTMLLCDSSESENDDVSVDTFATFSSDADMEDYDAIRKSNIQLAKPTRDLLGSVATHFSISATLLCDSDNEGDDYDISVDTFATDTSAVNDEEDYKAIRETKIRHDDDRNYPLGSVATHFSISAMMLCNSSVSDDDEDGDDSSIDSFAAFDSDDDDEEDDDAIRESKTQLAKAIHEISHQHRRKRTKITTPMEGRYFRFPRMIKTRGFPRLFLEAIVEEA